MQDLKRILFRELREARIDRTKLREKDSNSIDYAAAALCYRRLLGAVDEAELREEYIRYEDRINEEIGDLTKEKEAGK